MANFEQQLLITLVDKGLLALVVLAAGFVFNSVLQRRRARDSLLQAISAERVNAYKTLWEMTAPVRPSSDGEISSDTRNFLSECMTEWYYAKGGGLFLSHDAASLFLGARATLQGKAKADDVRSAFSALRSQLKFDCGVYSKCEQHKDLAWSVPSEEAA